MTARLRRAAQRVIDLFPVGDLTPHDQGRALSELAAAMPRTKRRPPKPSKVEREVRRERMARIRETVMERAQGHCEVCATGVAAECHHVLSGPLRRVRESVSTCLALCVRCHRGLHAGDLDTLESARLYAESCGMHDAVAALAKRIDKIHEARVREIAG